MIFDSKLITYKTGVIDKSEQYGFKSVKFSPVFDTSGRITHARGSYLTDYGKISVAWEKSEDGFIYTVNLPPEIKAEFELNNCRSISFDREKGIYSFLCKRRSISKV